MMRNLSRQNDAMLTSARQKRPRRSSVRFVRSWRNSKPTRTRFAYRNDGNRPPSVVCPALFLVRWTGIGSGPVTRDALWLRPLTESAGRKIHRRVS